MNADRDVLDIEEIGNLAGFTPAEGLARIKASTPVRKGGWLPALRPRPAAAMSAMAWGTAATVALVAALAFHAGPGKQARPTPPAGAAVVNPTAIISPAPVTTNHAISSAQPTTVPTSAPASGNVPVPSAPLATSIPTVAPSPTDLLSNSSFESADLSGYGPWQSTATRITTPVKSGSYALKVAQLSSGYTWFTIDSWPQVVNATAGTTYTASVYVAAPPAWVGKTVELVLRESVHDVKHTNQRLWVKDVTLTSAYQLVQVSGQADANDTMSVYLGPPSSQHAGSGEYFYADLLTLTAG
jgi:hypothetical protein